MTDAFLSIAKALLNIPTAPFHEHLALDFARSFAASRTGLATRTDPSGNLLLSYKGSPRSTQAPIVLTAHLDHPGLVWQQTLAPGKAYFQILGGVDLQQALASSVRIFDLERPANQRGTKAEITGTKDLPGSRYPLIEIACASETRLAAGVFAMWDLPAFSKRGTRLSGRALDDLAGAAVGLAVLDALQAANSPAHAHLLLTRAEEVGFVGMLAAIEAKFLRRKALYINIECSSVKAGARQGAGPVLRIGDRLWVFDPLISGGMVALAQSIAQTDPAFRFQRKLMDSGACEATALLQAGFRTGAVALPLGNYHNMGPGKGLAAENIDIEDARLLVRLLVELATQGIDTAQAQSSAALDEMLTRQLDKYRERL